jgi:hypothetical protein
MADPLLTPILDRLNPNVHFFEGRLLTALDLREQQITNRTRREMLGRAIRTGIVEGLEVSEVQSGSPDTSPVVQVAKGVALNPLGQLLVLNDAQQLTLSEVGESSDDDTGVFQACDPRTSTATFVGFGVYVLVISPVSGYTEYAPMIELGDEGVAKGCGRRYALEGVQFRLVELPLQNYPDISDAQTTLNAATTATIQRQALSRLRSIVAHAFLSSAATAQQRAQLYAEGATVFAPSNAALEELTALGLLDDCDVPLAVLFWDSESLRFVDNWAVRRLARWVLPPESCSLFPAAGLERLLQFQAHIAQLLIDLVGAASADVEDYFRYLPPAGYFPVQGGGSNAGFSASGFMQTYFDQIAGELTAGQLTRLLNESFAFESVDLDAEPYLQLFNLRQNSEALASGEASQRVRVFVTRELNGPMIDDGVAHVLEDAWDAYRALIRRRDFIPFGGFSNAREAIFAIEAAIRDVMDVANRFAAQAAAGGLDVTGALTAFDALYDVQDELIDIFQTDIPDFGDLLDRDIFTTGLQLLVEGNPAAGAAGLSGALASDQLHAIVAAQQAINDYVRNWQAGGVGPFGFTFLDAPSGVNLVPGAAAHWRFTFTNGRSETLRFRLQGEIDAPTGAWGSVILQNQAGQNLNNVTVASGVSMIVSAQFTTPADAVVGELAELKLSAEIRSTGEIEEHTEDIPIEEDSGGPLTSSVSFSGEPQVPDNTVDVPPSTPGNPSILTYGFPVTYVTTDGPESQDFEFELTFNSESFDEAWQVAIGDLQPITPDPANVFTRTLSLQNGVPTQINVNILVSPNAGAVAEFMVAIRSTGVTPGFSEALDTPFTIIVADTA